MVSFQIFESDKKTFHLNIENSLLLGILFFVILNSSDFFQPVAKYGLIAIIIFGLVYMITNYTRIRPLNGKLKGLLIINEDNLQIDTKIYSIENIAKIFIRINDFEGKDNGSFRLSFYPKLSNGTNNVLRLELKNGEKINLFFKSELEYDYEKLRPFVIKLMQHNLISIDQACKILKPYTEYEISKLQLEANKKELID